MKKRLYTLLCTAVVFAFVFTACIDDKMEQCPVGGNNHFTLSLVTDNPQTRAVVPEPGIGELNENKIERVDIFFYGGNILQWHASGAGISYDVSNKMMVIPVPDGKKNLFDGNTEYTIYVLVNNTADLSTFSEGADNLDELKAVVFQTGTFQTEGGLNAQASFVMDGVITRIPALTNPDLGTVNLKRVASKVRLALVGVDVEGYTYTGTAQARLVHFTDKSVLLDVGTTYAPLDDEWLETDYRNLSSGTGPDTTLVPFYAYSNDWNSDLNKETYLELRVPLEEDNTGETKYNLYRIPITPQDPNGEDAVHMNRMERNFLYDIKVTVNMLGGEVDEPVEIVGNYTIIDWTTNEVVAEVKALEYLVLSEYNVIMPNITDYVITFNSSKAPVTLVDGSLKVSYTYVNYDDGTPTTVFIQEGDEQWPQIIVQPNVADGTITIHSDIPTNYLPKDIVFQVTNGILTETVTIQQQSATYFTVEKGLKSNLRDEMQSGRKNPYMYTITTLAPAGDIIWGFPPLDNNGNTENSAETAKMVSPRFMMASQWGITDPMSYNTAVQNCKDYIEWYGIGDNDKYNDWRLPTEAEIKYIDNLQHIPSNMILMGYVLANSYYWDAYSGNNAYMMSDPKRDTASKTSAFVRCVRDIKD